jgi:hypothetical protein
LKPGDTIKSHHLLIICTDPLPDGNVVAFNLTSRDWDSDQTCVVKVGEHPYLVRDSVIAYKYGELLTPRHIARLQLLAPKEYGPVSPELLLRIQEGAVKSDQTPAYLKKIMADILKRKP